MKQNKQAGFTLIELIIVIVILGILAVTASPKFLDIQGDARKSTLEGLEGSLKGAANIVYSKALINNEANADDQALTGVTNVTVDYGYPRADETTLGAILELDAAEWEVHALTSIADAVRIYPAGSYEGADNEIHTDDTDCYLQYVMDDSAAGNTPAYTLVATSC